MIHKLSYVLLACLGVISPSHSQEQVMAPKNKAIYVLLESDTAYIEYFVIDKPNRHYWLDTLYKTNSDGFIGARSKLKITNKQYFLFLNDDTFDFRQIPLFPATKKQIRARNRRHNTMVYDLNLPNVRSKREFYVQTKNDDFASKLDGDWDRLLTDAEILDIDSFKQKIELFAKKFDIILKHH